MSEIRWFSGQDCVGVVKVDDPHDGIKYYIGVAIGNDEQDDIQWIAYWGSSFPTDAGDVLFGGIRYKA